ncbi:MAG: hypothetical protein PHN64_10230 [Desulfovibrionaceae bacterium]|nr:hypothetical protein [Desulfovibrionaceae bacterium]
MRYIDPAEKIYWCTRKGYGQPLLNCLSCPRYPCAERTEKEEAILQASAFTTLDKKRSRFVLRSKRMYIFKMEDGTLTPAPEDFNPEMPQFEQLEDVAEVLVIAKVLVKQLRLVAKPREERAALRKVLSTPDAAPESSPAPEENKNRAGRKKA